MLDDLSRARRYGSRLGNTSYSNWNFLARLPNVTLVRGSVMNRQLTRKLVKDVDRVVHLAAQVAVTTSVADPESDFRTNSIGTFNVVDACRLSRKSPRIVFASTNKVYGSNVNRVPVSSTRTRYRFSPREFQRGIDESFPLDLTEHSPYGVSKLSGDLYLQEYGHTYGLATGVFRMSCIYGPRQFGVSDQGWVAHFVLSALQGNAIQIYGDGKQVRDVLYVSDLVSAYDSFLNSRMGVAVFNMGGGPRNTLSLVELIELLEDRVKRPIRVKFHRWRPADQKVYISDISHAMRTLRWAPQVTPASGLEKLVTWAEGVVGPGRLS